MTDTLPQPSGGPRPQRLSVILITFNEIGRLPRCLQSVAFADEVILVDSGSTDGTAELAERLGARVLRTSDWPGFGPQKNRALELASGDWVLSLDADEWLSEGLAVSVQDVLGRKSPGPDIWALQRLSSFCGQWMRHSGWYPDRVPRLFRRGTARFSDDRVHERLVFEGRGRDVPALKGHLLHESIPTLSSAIDKMERYSSGRAADLAARGRPGGLGRALGHGFWAFVRTYVLRRGFLDGRLGLVLAIHNAESSYYRYLKIWLDHGSASGNQPR